MSCVIVGTIKCVERETKWYYLGCRACNFGVDPKTEDYKDKESGLVKKKTVGYICKNKSCGDVSDVLYKFKIQIRVLDNKGSVSLTLFDRIANALLNKEANELVEKQLQDGAIDVLPEDFNDLLEKNCLES
nr:nucleic acid-binding, OB-fold, replication protein A, OB domain protein [Tanacetum cinerariifolium]